jgi:Zn finger protein HypA/HybF involved in hydrogenase expression
MGMLDPGRFLVSCSKCEAWPMAANVKRSSWSAQPHEVSFVCPRCSHEETAIISASGELTPIKRVDVPPRDVTAAWAQAQRPIGRA